jgi:hypothetical protein
MFISVYDFPAVPARVSGSIHHCGRVLGTVQCGQGIPLDKNIARKMVMWCQGCPLHFLPATLWAAGHASKGYSSVVRCRFLLGSA